MGYSVTSQIEGVVITPLRRFFDERGSVMHMLRCDSPHFENFGEIYFSFVKQARVKAWKRHRRVIQNFAVPVGSIKLVLFDDRPDSPSRGSLEEVVVGTDNYVLVKIPPMLWYGFAGLADGQSMVANCATQPHDPEESDSISPSESTVPYTW